MGNVKSVQETNVDASPRVPLRSDESHSRLRRQFFRYVHKNAALPTSGDNIALCRIPKGARLNGGLFLADAGIGADTTKVSLGVAGDVAGYMAATVMGATAVALEFNHTRALDFGVLTTTETILIGTISVADTDGVDDLEIVGYIDFTVD